MPTINLAGGSGGAGGTMAAQGGAKPAWPGATPGKKVGLTEEQGLENQEVYNTMPRHVRDSIEAHPMVAMGGMQPHAALSLLQSSGRRLGHQNIEQTLQHYMPAQYTPRAQTLMSGLNPTGRPVQAAGAMQV